MFRTFVLLRTAKAVLILAVKGTWKPLFHFQSLRKIFIHSCDKRTRTSKLRWTCTANWATQPIIYCIVPGRGQVVHLHRPIAMLLSILLTNSIHLKFYRMLHVIYTVCFFLWFRKDVCKMYLDLFYFNKKFSLILNHITEDVYMKSIPNFTLISILIRIKK